MNQLILGHIPVSIVPYRADRKRCKTEIGSCSLNETEKNEININVQEGKEYLKANLL